MRNKGFSAKRYVWGSILWHYYGTKLAGNWRNKADDMKTKKLYTGTIPNWERAKKRPLSGTERFLRAAFLRGIRKMPW